MHSNAIEMNEITTFFKLFLNKQEAKKKFKKIKRNFRMRANFQIHNRFPQNFNYLFFFYQKDKKN